MKFSDEGVKWAAAQFSQFRGLHGFPDNNEGLKARAKALLRLAHPVVVCKRYASAIAVKKWADHFHELPQDRRKEAGPMPKPETVTEQDWLANWEAMELALLPEDSEFGAVNPVDWLIDKALDGARFCPTPADLRELFGRKFDCADGAKPEDLPSFSAAAGAEGVSD